MLLLILNNLEVLIKKNKLVLRYKSKVSDMDNNSALLVAGYEDKKIILWDPNSKA